MTAQLSQLREENTRAVTEHRTEAVHHRIEQRKRKLSEQLAKARRLSVANQLRNYKVAANCLGLYTKHKARHQ